MKSILLIGLGRFGRHMAIQFQKMNCEVLAVDDDEQRVNDVLPYVTSAQIGDSTNEQFIASLGVRNFDVCVVAIGDNFQSSLETTALLKDNGARLVVARANRDVHAKFLLRNGADEVVYPEKEMAVRAAVRFGADNVFDFIQLAGNISIYETATPAAWVGKSIVDLQVRQRFRVHILAVKHGEETLPVPSAEYVFRDEDRLLLMGADADMEKFLHF